LPAFLAEIAFIHDLLFRVPVSCTVRTGRNAAAAVDAQSIIHLYGAVSFIPVGGAGGACLDTGGILTVHAIARLKMHFPEITHRGSFNPIAIGSRGNTVGYLAGNDAGLAIKTPGRIYHHGILDIHDNS
jgi:hypothetical protein